MQCILTGYPLPEGRQATIFYNSNVRATFIRICTTIAVHMLRLPNSRVVRGSAA